MNIKLVGILNVTPDSFSDGGLYLSPDVAIAQAHNLVSEGADIVDIGGQSTRPGSKSIGAAEEIKRINPVLKEVATFAPVSVDTYRSEVAAFAIENGASIINDVTSGSDPAMFDVIADSDAKIVLMYSALTKPHDFSFQEREVENSGVDLIVKIREFFHKKLEKALESNILAEQIILDPGMGAFVSKRPEYSWQLIRRFKELAETEFPLMFASSRKGFLKQEGESSPIERDPLTALTGTLVAQDFGFHGPDYIRVHNVKLQRAFLNTAFKVAIMQP